MKDLIPLLAIFAIFIGMPWLFLHYRTKSKQARSLSIEDERMLDDLYHAAQRLEDRVLTIERIIAVDNPDWRRIAAEDRIPDRIETGNNDRIRRIS
jgi:phage shock protein B